MVQAMVRRAFLEFLTLRQRISKLPVAGRRIHMKDAVIALYQGQHCYSIRDIYIYIYIYIDIYVCICYELHNKRGSAS